MFFISPSLIWGGELCTQCLLSVYTCQNRLLKFYIYQGMHKWSPKSVEIANEYGGEIYRIQWVSRGSLKYKMGFFLGKEFQCKYLRCFQIVRHGRLSKLPGIPRDQESRARHGNKYYENPKKNLCYRESKNISKLFLTKILDGSLPSQTSPGSSSRAGPSSGNRSGIWQRSGKKSSKHSFVRQRQAYI